MSFSRISKTNRVLTRSLAAAAAHAPRATPTHVQELQNGVRLAQEVRPRANTSAVALVLDFGSRNEKEDNSGVASLLLRAWLNNPALNKDLRRAGAQLVAHTSRDTCQLGLRALESRREEALSLLAKIVTQDVSRDQMDDARRQLLSEQEARDRDLKHVVLDNLHKVAFQGTALELPPLGRSQSVRQLELSQLEHFRDAHVLGPRLALALVSPKEFSNDFSKLFSSLKNSSNISAISTPEGARFTGSDIRVRDDALPLAHVAICVEGPPRDSKDLLALQLCHELFGRWDATYGGGADVSSYLGVCSALERVTHSFESLLISYRETALFGVRMCVERMKHEDAVQHVTLEWKRFCAELTENELKRGKNALMANAARGRESPLNAALVNAEQLLRTGNVESVAEMEARVLAVKASEVRAVAEKYIWDKCPAVSAVGPVEQLEDYEVLRGKFYWMRY